MCKKGLSVLVLLSLWMCLTGFASLGEEGKDTWNSMMEQLSAEEIDQLLAEENEWYGKVMANVEDSVTIRAEASSDSLKVMPERFWSSRKDGQGSSLEMWTDGSAMNIWHLEKTRKSVQKKM